MVEEVHLAEVGSRTGGLGGISTSATVIAPLPAAPISGRRRPAGDRAPPDRGSFWARMYAEARPLVPDDVQLAGVLLADARRCRRPRDRPGSTTRSPPGTPSNARSQLRPWFRPAWPRSIRTTFSFPSAVHHLCGRGARPGYRVVRSIGYRRSRPRWWTGSRSGRLAVPGMAPGSSRTRADHAGPGAIRRFSTQPPVRNRRPRGQADLVPGLAADRERPEPGAAGPGQAVAKTVHEHPDRDGDADPTADLVEAAAQGFYRWGAWQPGAGQ